MVHLLIAGRFKGESEPLVNYDIEVPTSTPCSNRCWNKDLFGIALELSISESKQYRSSTPTINSYIHHVSSVLLFDDSARVWRRLCPSEVTDFSDYSQLYVAFVQEDAAPPPPEDIPEPQTPRGDGRCGVVGIESMLNGTPVGKFKSWRSASSTTPLEKQVSLSERLWCVFLSISTTITTTTTTTTTLTRSQFDKAMRRLGFKTMKSGVLDLIFSHYTTATPSSWTRQDFDSFCRDFAGLCTLLLEHAQVIESKQNCEDAILHFSKQIALKSLEVERLVIEQRSLMKSVEALGAREAELLRDFHRTNVETNAMTQAQMDLLSKEVELQLGRMRLTESEDAFVAASNEFDSFANKMKNDPPSISKACRVLVMPKTD